MPNKNDRLIEVSSGSRYVATVWKKGVKLYWAGSKNFTRHAIEAIALSTRKAALIKAKQLQRFIDRDIQQTQKNWEKRKKAIGSLLKDAAEVINSTLDASIKNLDKPIFPKKSDRASQGTPTAPRIPTYTTVQEHQRKGSKGVSTHVSTHKRKLSDRQKRQELGRSIYGKKR